MSARRTAGVVAGVVTAGAVAAAVTVFNLPAAESGSKSSTGTVTNTAEIAKETLIDRESHDGTLGHGATVTLGSKGGGTVTWLPAVGATVSRGKALYKLDNKPVVLLYGSLPAYRMLRSGMKGADVKQFEKNLWALGYRGFTVDDKFTASTAAAVKDWQDEVDLTMDAQRLAVEGAAVRIEMPDGGTVSGKIVKVGTTVQKGQGDEPDTTLIEVTIAFAGAPKGLDDAAVTVDFTAGERKDVLTVPVAALLALAEGGYGVQVVDGAGTKIVAVRTAGMKVGMPL
jgi:hypothetical protein